ncbi:MAG: hypothetical protein WCK03_03625 [Candidatus Taylorbacteria bacterium]
MILDVQSSVVYASLVLTKEGENPFVIFYTKKDIRFREKQTSSQLITATVASIKSIMSSALEYLVTLRQSSTDIPKKISGIHYVLSSPWILSESKRIEVTFDSPTAITHDLIRNIIDDEREKLSVGAHAEGKSVEVEEKIFNIELNGYTVADWIGKKANSLSVSFITSISGTKMIERFRDISSSVMNRHNVFFHSSLFLQYLGIVHLFPEKKNYILTHVHGEITDIVIVTKNACVFFGTFPMGTNTILRSLSHKSHRGMKTTESMVKLRINDALSSDADIDSDLIDAEYDKWVEEFEKMAKYESGNTHIMSPIILSTHDSYDLFKMSLERKFPNITIEPFSEDQSRTEVGYGQSLNRSVLADLYIIAIEKFRLQ